MYSTSQQIVLTDEERVELTLRLRARSLRASDAQRARLILLLADGVAYRSVADKLGCSQTTVSLWRQRFLDRRLEGLYGQHRGSRTTAEGRRLEARILALTQKQPRRQHPLHHPQAGSSTRGEPHASSPSLVSSRAQAASPRPLRRLQ